MMCDPVKPLSTSEIVKRLNKIAPTRRDWALYCPRCGFVGEPNAAYGAAFMASHQLRLWRGGQA